MGFPPGGQERTPTARTRQAPGPAGPWPDLSAYARQPARGPTMLAHLVAMLAYLAGNVGPAWGYVGPAWGYKEQQKTL